MPRHSTTGERLEVPVHILAVSKQNKKKKTLENSQIVLYRLRQYFHKTLVPTLASLLSSHTQSFPRRYS